jgi:2,4-dienoyl-CoA reductase-like NADH-dependent reductase (Old Yellow Enzyme family)
LPLGPVELPNRIVSTAHQTTLVHEHLPTDDFVAYHEARARGGVGLIVLEATAVHPSGLLTSHTLGGYLPEIVDGYRRVAAAVRPHGTRLFVQLLHSGREQIATPPRAPAIAPSAVPSPRFRSEPRALSAAEIEELVAGYARSAGLAAEAGLDGIELSAAHRYLLEQFLDPELNRREDEWRDGGRFLVEVVRAVRGAAPGLCIGVRLSADSPRAASIVELTAQEGIDYLSLALGDSSSYLGSVGIVPPPPVEEAAIAQLMVDAELPRIATSRVVDVELADRLVGERRAEALGMTRALIADPDLPRKAREGRLAERIGCIGCNACIAHYHAGTELRCAVNPRTGRERRLSPPLPSERRRLVVVGGGPAGIAAAVDAGRAGHEVVLLEREQRLGGQLALAGAAPGGRELAERFLDNAERGLAASGVVVRLGTTWPQRLEADAYVLATGARPYRGDEGLAAWDVLAGTIPEGDRVLVADWGGDPAGLDAAEVLAAAGKEVTLAVASVAVGELVHQYRRNLYLQRLYRAGVRIVHHHELAPGPVLRNVFAPELMAPVEADAVVLALGRVPVEVEAPPGARVEHAGDCLSPRSLEEAVLEGTLAARRAVA